MAGVNLFQEAVFSHCDESVYDIEIGPKHFNLPTNIFQKYHGNCSAET